ncbi:uncharacterized protein RCC_07344 [Ramularia collo-cygni]|uniref:Uncharacterized protein n=1 Tax=Ramularia collo-cygni TaxID=112498 RepID=A0A2D3UXC6_9PEZI|nr:uncharacterized protein RCC_07344 [Ramularia collo-cygni]CZT21481.1 uncharacterized protein RCC_07344 [Ramularia collo-cygni]
MFSELALTSFLAATALAVPHQHAHQHRHYQRNTHASNFTITVNNNCTKDLSVATFGMSDTFIITQESATHVIEPSCSANISTNYYGVGMRLSPNAHLPIAMQYLPQAMFEYGYSNTGPQGLSGTAYDLSLMGHVAPGIKVVPAHPECEPKCCTPGNCPIDQGWTSAAQSYAADVTCYQGMVDFEVTFCPNE